MLMVWCVSSVPHFVQMYLIQKIDALLGLCSWRSFDDVTRVNSCVALRTKYGADVFIHYEGAVLAFHEIQDGHCPSS